MTVQRFDFGTEYRGNTGVPGIVGKIDGRYVLYEDYLALKAAQQHGEPVAYAVLADNGNIRIWSREPLDDPGAVPLYACPQPAAPAQEPSDELEMFETWFLASNPSWEITPQEKRSGTYVFERANIQWVAWQARALLARYGAKSCDT